MNPMRISLLAVSLIVALPAAAYDEKRSIPNPAYTGECNVDQDQLLKFTLYWNSGTHGTNQCLYQIDQKIIHQELAHYVGRAKRCRYNGITYMPVTSTAYVGAVIEVANDDVLKEKLNYGVVDLSKHINCSPIPRQQTELNRQEQQRLAH